MYSRNPAKSKTLKMSQFLTRYLRKLSTAAPSAAAASSSYIPFCKARTKLRLEFDPDKVLEIYSSFREGCRSDVARGYVHFNERSPLSYRYVLDLTLKRLARVSRFADIEALIESEKNDLRITQEDYLCSLIRSYGVAGMFEHALRTFNQMEELGTPRSSVSFNALLAASNRCSLFDQVPKLFNEIPKKYGILPDKVSYGILIRSYCESGLPGKAFEVLREMEAKGVEITTVAYSTILDVLYKQGQTDKAEKVWQEMVKKGDLDVAAYNQKIMSVHSGDPENVKALIDEMSNGGLKPNTISYNYLMASYCQSGMMDKAKKVYAELEGNGCRRNANTFKTLIYYLCRSGDFEAAYKVFKLSAHCHKLSDFGTLKPLVEGLVEKKKTRDAKGLIRTAKKQFPADSLDVWVKLQEELGLEDEESPQSTGEDAPPATADAQEAATS